MKCIKSNEGVVVKVNDVQADARVKTGIWVYVPKSEWKKINKTEKPQPTKVGETVVVKNKKPPKQSKQEKNKRGR
jgi:hypothetical protein